MRILLIGFLVLFVGAELFQWLMHLGIWQPSGAGLWLGGLGLAVMSNVAHLPRFSAGAGADVGSDEMAIDTADSKATAAEELAVSEGPVSEISGSEISVPETADSKSASHPSASDRTESDSISFQVRFPWY